MTVESVKSNLNVYKNDEHIAGITSLSVDESETNRYVYEMLTEEPWATVSSEKKYVITLDIFGECPVFEDEGFSLTLEYNSRKVKYNYCKIKSLNTSYVDGNLTTKLQISSAERTE